tara:strand:+ start:80 stop:487 length:408 start_codon:yes stop_codon:yes gene_type:complete
MQDSDNNVEELSREKFAQLHRDLKLLEDSLPIWKESLNDRSSLTEIRRGLRRIKIMARSLSLGVAVEVADAAENLLNRVVEGTIAISSQIFLVIQEVEILLLEVVEAAEQEQVFPNNKVDLLIERADLLASGMHL